MPGIIPTKPVNHPTNPAPLFPVSPGDRMEKTHALWNGQMGFDEDIHVKRDLYYPLDAESNQQRDEITLHWVWGQAFALLQETDEIYDALQEMNAEEETVDILHFTMSLACKLNMTPSELGHFEDTFQAAQNEAKVLGYESFEQAYRLWLPHQVKGISDLIGNSFKWWKDQPNPIDWKPFQEAVKRIHYWNFVLASTVFPTADAMYDQYMLKVQENHDRQKGAIKGREDYQST